jgi:uncharacterized integral membrane protein
MHNVYLVLGIILGLGIALFALQNGTPVSVRFLAWQIDGPLAGVVLGSAGAGALLVFLIGVPQFLAARWRITALERELAQARPAAAPPGPARPPESPRPPSSPPSSA